VLKIPRSDGFQILLIELCQKFIPSCMRKLDHNKRFLFFLTFL
jgi:hypothetical protein